MKVFSRHRCSEKHERFYELARCMFPKATVIGDGRFAVLSEGRSRVWLFTSRADAFDEARDLRGSSAGDVEAVELSRNGKATW